MLRALDQLGIEFGKNGAELQDKVSHYLLSLIIYLLNLSTIYRITIK